MDHCGSRDEEGVDELVSLIREEWGQDQHPEALIRQVEGILDINTVEHRVQARHNNASLILSLDKASSSSPLPKKSTSIHLSFMFFIV